MTRRLLLDTNILIYYFNGELPVQAIVETIIMGQAMVFIARLAGPNYYAIPN
jgi:predicted nucleic acid-binding protein